MSKLVGIKARETKIFEDVKNDPSNKLKYDELKEHVNEVVRELNSYNGDFSSAEFCNILAKIRYMHHFCEPSSLVYAAYQEMGWHLSKTEYTNEFLKVASSLFPKFCDENSNEQSQLTLTLYELLTGFMNFADKCSTLGEQLGKLGGIKVLLDFAQRLDARLDWLNIRLASGVNTKLQILQKVLGILHNCARHNTVNRGIYRKANAVGFLEAKTKCPDVSIRIDSVLILAHIADEKMTERVRPHLDCIFLLVELLRRSVESKRLSISVVCESTQSSSYSYSAEELANALLRLAVNDGNKVAIYECDGLPILMKMLRNRSVGSQALKALHLMRQLVFIDDIKNDQLILNAKPLLELMMESGGNFLKEIATQILWEISNHQMTIPPYAEDPRVEKESPFYLLAPLEPETSERCIKFSFHQDWEGRYQALFIRDRLVQEGFNVWVHEYLLRVRNHAEQTAVLKRSDALVVFVNEEYKEKARLRSELTYAKQLGIPLIPLLTESEYTSDGWLQEVLDIEPIRFCSAEDIDRNLPRLIEALGDHGKPEGQLGNTTNRDSSSVSSEEIFQNACKKHVRYWSSNRVNRWLKENGLDVHIRFPGNVFQGNQLLQIYGHYCQNRDKLEKEFKMDLKVDGAIFQKFCVALKNLVESEHRLNIRDLQEQKDE